MNTPDWEAPKPPDLTPEPAPEGPKKRFWQKRWVQITGAAILVLGILGAIFGDPEEDDPETGSVAVVATTEPSSDEATESTDPSPEPTTARTEPTPEATEPAVETTAAPTTVAPTTTTTLACPGQESVDAALDRVVDMMAVAFLAVEAQEEGNRAAVDFHIAATEQFNEEGPRAATSVTSNLPNQSTYLLWDAEYNLWASAARLVVIEGGDITQAFWERLVDDQPTWLEWASELPSDCTLPETDLSDTMDILRVDAPEAPELPAEYRNALRSAQSYLDFTNFSRLGLIGQLEFEDYSTEAATWAADNVGADWREQAYGSGISYLEFSAFSYQGLLDQLLFEEYTSDEATYAVDRLRDEGLL